MSVELAKEKLCGAGSKKICRSIPPNIINRVEMVCDARYCSCNDSIVLFDKYTSLAESYRLAGASNIAHQCDQKDRHRYCNSYCSEGKSMGIYGLISGLNLTS